MNRRLTSRWRILALLVLALLLPGGARPWAEGGRVLTVLYTGSLSGNLDGCTCERIPTAGLVKRAAWLKDGRPPGPALLVDAGNILDEYPDPDLSREILEVYRELGYDAVAVGDHELAEGSRALAGYRRKFPFLVSGNLPAFAAPAPRVVERGGVRVGIVALAEPGLFAPAVKAAPAAPAAREGVRRARQAGAELVLLLYHGTRAGLAGLLAECEGIDLAIYTHEGRLDPPTRVGATLVASPGEEGNHLGVLTLTLAGGRIASFEGRLQTFTFRRDPDDPGVRRRIERYREALRRRLGN